MKVITNDAIYIQRSDFANIIKIDLNVPTTLRLQAFNKTWFMLDDDNRFDFMRFDKPEEVAAFGDGGNDREMLELAGHSYAVANASDEIKKVARYIIQSNARDGVLNAIENILERES